jgi:hypothetical protein
MQARMALRGGAGDGAKADFLGGTRSARPDCDAVRKPRHVIIADELANGRLPCGDMPRLHPGHFWGRAEPAPPWTEKLTRGGLREIFFDSLLMDLV